MSDDEDWFEQAIGGDDGPDDPDDQGTDADPDDRPSDGTGPGEDGGTGASRGGSQEGAPSTDGTRSNGRPAGDASDRGTGAEGPFDRDFATALENAPDPGGFGGGSVPGSAGPDASPPFGAEGFDEAEFDSDIDRIDIGITGLDEMILGGVPERSLIVALGAAGTGKTTLGLQFLNRALEAGDDAVYISLEESRDHILDTAEEKGWPFRDYEAEGSLAVLSLDPVEMATTLANIRDDLPRLVDEFEADRLVLDSVSLVEMMYDHPARRRSEVYDFTRALKEGGVTTLFTSEADVDNPYSSRYGLVEYLADAVFVLQYVRGDNFQETRLAVEIQKIRDANHSRQARPYEITDEGISVYRQANIF